MGITPRYVGKYGRLWTINLNTDSGGDNITGLTAGAFAVIVRNVNTKVETQSTGNITIVSSVNPAQITWQPTAADFAVAGNFEAIVQVTLASGPDDYDPIPFEIVNK